MVARETAGSAVSAATIVAAATTATAAAVDLCVGGEGD